MPRSSTYTPADRDVQPHCLSSGSYYGAGCPHAKVGRTPWSAAGPPASLSELGRMHPKPARVSSPLVAMPTGCQPAVNQRPIEGRPLGQAFREYSVSAHFQRPTAPTYIAVHRRGNSTGRPDAAHVGRRQGRKTSGLTAGWQAEAYPTSGIGFFMGFRGPKAHSNRPGGLRTLRLAFQRL